MKGMKGLSVNRVIGTIKRRTGTGLGGGASASNAGPSDETPEARAVRCVKQFCESGGPNKQGDEVLYLPPIVEAAESSPAAAAECARYIRKYLSKDYATKPSWQYNALMLMRILTDNPGPSFTRNFDKKFVEVIRELLKSGRDPSVRQMLMETLHDFEQSKAGDQGLAELIAMWQKEKDRVSKRQGGGQPPFPNQNQPPMGPPGFNAHSQNYFARHHSNKSLPSPGELAGRLEEARSSAKLLSQVVANTPPAEILDNELVKEFADRCQSASRTIQLYMVADNPAPDNDTMETLIDTNEQLQTALNQHQRAVLGARKQMGLNINSESNSPRIGSHDMTNNNQPPMPPPNTRPQQWQPSQVSPASSIGQGQGQAQAHPPPTRKPVGGVGGAVRNNSNEDFAPPPGPPPGLLASKPSNDTEEDPFRDPQPEQSSSSINPAQPGDQRLAYEPYHPGFNPTPSYVGRQNSALGNTTMHGAGVQPSEAAPGAPTHAPPPNPTLRQNTVDDDDDDLYGSNDIYDSTPRRQQQQA